MNHKSKPSFLFIVFSSIVAGLTVAAMVMAWTNPSGNPPIGGGALYYSGGNVGIGTSTPTTGKLVLYGGNLDITNNKIINLAAPTIGSDAATRQYVLDTVGAAGGGGDSTSTQLIQAKVSSLVGLPVFGGDGSDGDVTISSPTSINSAIKQYNNLTLSSALTSSESGPTGLFIAVKNTLTINAGGSISATGKGYAGGAPGGPGVNGAPGLSCVAVNSRLLVNPCVTGAGGGGGAGIGGNSTLGGDGGGAGASGGFGGWTAGTNGQGGTATSQFKLTVSRLARSNLFVSFDIATSTSPGLVGAGGGGGGHGNSGGTGGAGGGIIYIEADTIVNNASSCGELINAGGGGGGGGGLIWIRARNLTSINTISVTTSGGSGGANCTGGPGTSGVGGAGAAGTVLIEKVI